MAVEQVVPKYQGGGVTSQELLADQEGLGQAIRAGLDRVGEIDSPGAAITQQPLKCGLVGGGADDQNIADSCQHQCAEWVIDHRLVVHRHQLLAHRSGERSEPTAAATGQDDPFTVR